MTDPPIDSMVELRRFNGVVPHLSHPATIARMLNAMEGLVQRNQICVMFDNWQFGITNDADFRLPIPVRVGVTRLRVDFLIINRGGGDQTVKVTCPSDPPGVQVHCSLQPAGADPTQTSHGHWTSGGSAEGDGAAAEERALRVSAPWEWITYVGNANTHLFGICFTEIHSLTLTTI